MNLSGLGSLMKNAGKIQEMMQQNQQELENTVVTGSAGAGDVEIDMTCKHYVKDIRLSDSIMQEEKAIIEDLIAAAVNDATNKITTVTKEKMSGLGNMFGVDIPSDML